MLQVYFKKIVTVCLTKIASRIVLMRALNSLVTAVSQAFKKMQYNTAPRMRDQQYHWKIKESHYLNTSAMTMGTLYIKTVYLMTVIIPRTTKNCEQ